MKTMYKILLTITFISCLSFLTSCVAPHKLAGVQITPQIDLHVIGNPKELKVITPGSVNCKAAAPAKGCVAVGVRDTALINFELKTSPGWHFTEIKICKNGTKATQVCSLNEYQVAVFMATDSAGTDKLFPDASGVIDLTPLSAVLTEFFLLDYNPVKQDFFYTITACNPDAVPECIATDPLIENGGRR